MTIILTMVWLAWLGFVLTWLREVRVSASLQASRSR
jgi:hypothetical protein